MAAQNQNGNNPAMRQEENIWTRTNMQLSAMEQRGEKMKLLVQTAEDKLKAIKIEAEKLMNLKKDIGGQLEDRDKKIKAAEAEKESLFSQVIKAAEELAILQRQVQLLTSAYAEAQRQRGQEKEMRENDLTASRNKLKRLKASNSIKRRAKKQ